MAQFALTILASDNSADAATIYPNTLEVQSVRAATAGDIASFPSAVSAVTIRTIEQNTPRIRRYLSSSSVATVNAAIAAANAGVLGSGVSGQTTLVAGTKAITINGLTTSSLAVLQLVSPSGASSTVQYKAVCTANTLTITALVAAGTINTSDVSVINYAIVG